MASSHEHCHARGGMYVEGWGHQGVARNTGKYTPEMGAVYGKACRQFCSQKERIPLRNRPRTGLRAFADRSPVGRESAAPAHFSHGAAQFLLCSDDQCVDLIGENHLAAPYSRPCEPGGAPATGAVGATTEKGDGSRDS